MQDMNRNDKLGTPTGYALYDHFAHIAQTHPNTIAIESAQTYINYQELEQHVTQVANLLNHHGLHTGDRIGLYLSHSVDFVVAVLACLKQGITFVPLNIENPAAYLDNIIKDADVRAIITNEAKPDIAQLPVRSINITDHCNALHPLQYASSGYNDEVYMIFTSGSTGTPKGVVITQEALLALISQTCPLFSITSSNRIPLFHSLGFDFAMWELFSTLLVGATLVIPPSNIRRQLSQYFAYVFTQHISVLNMTPSVFYLFTLWLKDQPNSTQHIRTIILGGEPLTTQHRQAWFALPCSQQIELYNLYGITEATIHATYKRVEPTDDDANSLIGTPLPHIEAKVVDSSGNEVLPRQTGMLWLGGIAIAKGYFKQAKLTSNRFVHHTFTDTATKRWFRTGDLVKLLPNKQLAYIRREDDTIKIRGFRVSCSEIAQLIIHIEGVQQAVVIPYHHQNENRLAAFIVLDAPTLSEQTIRIQLANILPDYMIPTKIYCETELPISTNGKIDTTLLQDKLILDRTAMKHTEYTDNFKNSVQLIWSQVLQRNDIDTKTNFFDIGGDSLLLVKLQFELQQHFNQSFSIMDLIRFPNTESFTNHFDKNRS